MSEPTTTLAVVPDLPPMIRAALQLADYALELRAQGRRCEMAEKVLEETPEGHTRSGTMPMLMNARYDEMTIEFDRLAALYVEAKAMSITEARNA